MVFTKQLLNNKQYLTFFYNKALYKIYMKVHIDYNKEIDIIANKASNVATATTFRNTANG